MSNKIYYEFIRDGTIYEIDKEKSEIERSIQLVIERTNYLPSIMRSDKAIRKALKFDPNIKMTYRVFDNIHIMDSDNNLISCKYFKIFYFIDRENKLITSNFVNFYRSDKSDESSVDLDIKFQYNTEDEIIKIIKNNFYKVVYHLIYTEELNFYKFLDGFGYIQLGNFINLFNEINDEKKIKNYIIKKEFN